MSSNDHRDVPCTASEMDSQAADQVRHLEDERTRGLILASAEHAESQTRQGHFSQAELGTAVQAVERDFRQARDKRTRGEELAGLERRKYPFLPKD